MKMLSLRGRDIEWSVNHKGQKAILLEAVGTHGEVWRERLEKE